MNQNPTILIVDDDVAGRESLKGVLFSQGYELIEAENGPQAIALAKECIPDLILLDVMMPEIDGFEVCRRLRNDSLLAEIPILMITALDDRSSRLAGIEAGADDFISKPYDRVELRSRVRTITRLNRYRRIVLERARFVWVIENDRDSYLILDETGQINYANLAAQKLFHLLHGQEEGSPELFIEKVQQSFLMVPPKQWENWPRIENPEDCLYLVSQNHCDEEMSNPHWYEVRLLDLPWVSKQQRLLRVQEITDRMSLQLETWNFQSAINHKLMTPLSNIRLSFQIMRRLVNQRGDSDLLGCVETIENGYERLECEIKDILQYIHSPALISAGGKLSLSGLEDVVLQTGNELSIETIRFSTTCPSEPRDFSISRRAVQVILWEILENTKKFHPQLNPVVEVSLSTDASSLAELRIQDNGIWLQPQVLTNALKPYFQGEKQFTGEVQGMGLGLPTVAALLWQVGGDIALYNRQDRPGLVVNIKIPLE